MMLKARVTDQGLLIPKEMVERLGAEEVEIFEESGRLLIALATHPHISSAKPGAANDPIRTLGTNPVNTSTTDGSTNAGLDSVC